MFEESAKIIFNTLKSTGKVAADLSTEKTHDNPSWNYQDDHFN